MIKLLLSSLLISALALAVLAQRSNDAIAKQIGSLKAERNITLTYDAGSDSTKIMATAESFDSKESSRAAIQAMNFGMAFFYAGKQLNSPADPINLTFWVLTKQPRFATENKWIVVLGKETLDLGQARYAAKPGISMEYLNFKISRADLIRIAGANHVRFKLGARDFTFTASHLALFENILAVSDTAGK